MCHTPNKLRYHTMRDAALGALDALSQHGSAQRPYECPSCHAWHLTSHDKNGHDYLPEHVAALAAALNLEVAR